jgi:hypothetical protein
MVLIQKEKRESSTPDSLHGTPKVWPTLQYPCEHATKDQPKSMSSPTQYKVKQFQPIPSQQLHVLLLLASPQATNMPLRDKLVRENF